MHATPESFGPNQSPLAADLACARLPYHRTAPSRTAPTFAARERTTFRRLSASWSTDFNLAVPGHPMGPSERVTRAQLRECSVSTDPWLLRPIRAPRTRFGFSKSGAAIFSPKSPEWLAFFSRVLTDENQRCSGDAGVSTAAGPGKPATPAHMVAQNLPTSRNCWEPWRQVTEKAQRVVLIRRRV